MPTRLGDTVRASLFSLLVMGSCNPGPRSTHTKKNEFEIPGASERATTGIDML